MSVISRAKLKTQYNRLAKLKSRGLKGVGYASTIAKEVNSLLAQFPKTRPGQGKKAPSRYTVSQTFLKAIETLTTKRPAAKPTRKYPGGRPLELYIESLNRGLRSVAQKARTSNTKAPMAIYKIQNALTGKVYIGQTVVGVQRRFKQHIRSDKNGIGAEIRKLGAENFIVETLATAKSKDQLNTLERQFAEQYKATNPKFGYNRINNFINRGRLQKPGFIYEIRDRISGKRYVGQTVLDPKKRFQQHVREDTGLQIGSIIRRQGVQNFELKVLARGKTRESLDRLERSYIKRFGTNNWDNGVNINPGNRKRTAAEAAQYRYLTGKLSKFRRSTRAPQGILDEIERRLKVFRG